MEQAKEATVTLYTPLAIKNVFVTVLMCKPTYYVFFEDLGLA